MPGEGQTPLRTKPSERELVVSYRQMREAVRDVFAQIDRYDLFVNHTLWNRPSDQLLFGAFDPDSRTRQLFVLTIEK